ncbi:hypothetical protein NGM10_13960 [Halorussus salilacus]|uniref:hypothetical protein n=1 Tax=Halorussus salilacus TaxID=2953750 RepID=UPI00209DE9F2|nr:hypothetical protein [Halorussus salilacus]USZ67826.1 hypothetical protein NGM10_13960 [Halorussus salilacus]
MTPHARRVHRATAASGTPPRLEDDRERIESRPTPPESLDSARTAPESLDPAEVN